MLELSPLEAGMACDVHVMPFILSKTLLSVKMTHVRKPEMEQLLLTFKGRKL